MAYLNGDDGESRYNKTPAVTLGDEHRLWQGNEAWSELRRFAETASHRPIIVIDTYPGVDVSAVEAELASGFPGYRVINVEEEAAKSIGEIDALIRDNLTDDRVFGVLCHRDLADFYVTGRLAEIAERVATSMEPTILVGWGAALVPTTARVLVLADLARWEIQQRQRAGAPNWRSNNVDEDDLRKFKRGYFVEWRIADRHKRSLFDEVDYILDTNASVGNAKLINGNSFREGMRKAVSGPFRVVPFFDSGVWGGQWMKEVCGLDGDPDNYAWCFDCVPEENSLLLKVDGVFFELPAIDVVFVHPKQLLGEVTFARFGAEFPIRFDFLDTMDGGNLSLQVHPLMDYIHNKFGMPYTQDESYYLLDSSDDAVVYLGLKSGTDSKSLIDALHLASAEGGSFQVDEYVNAFPAKKHDHFLIPAGTVHCSGANAMVLEISATPYIFTFKMWDWARVGLDGKPRPIHLEHAIENIQWNRDTEWTTANLIAQVRTVASGDGWLEEVTGLHELEFIEVRRHWFTKAVQHHTNGTVNVLNLVEGTEAVVESPSGAFEPLTIHYAETFIVPAGVGAYTVRPYGTGIGKQLATIKAFVRGTNTEGG